MKSIRNLKLVNNVALVALALSFSASLGKAQNAFEGKFTLPFEARWGSAVLPAGDYTFTLPSTAAPYLLYVRGEGKAAIVLTSAADTKAISDHSQLTIVDAGGEHFIRMLEAGPLGLTFDYTVPKATAIARAHKPMQHVPVSAGGR